MLKQARYLPILWCICCTEDAPLVQRYVRYPKKKRLLNPFVTVNVTIILHFVKFNKIKYLNIWILPNTSILSEEIPSTELSSTIFYPFATRLYFCKRWCNTPMSFYSLSVFIFLFITVKYINLQLLPWSNTLYLVMFSN